MSLRAGQEFIPTSNVSVLKPGAPGWDGVFEKGIIAEICGGGHQLLYSFSVGTAKKYSTYVSKCTCFEFGQMIKKVSLVCYYIDGIGSEIDLSALLVLPACMRHHEYLTRWMLSMSQPGALNTMESHGIATW